MNYKDCLIDLTTMIEITFAQTKTTHAVTSALYEIQYKLKSILNNQLIVFFQCKTEKNGTQFSRYHSSTTSLLLMAKWNPVFKKRTQT